MEVNGEIEKLIRLGEDSVREFKSMRISGKRVAEPDRKTFGNGSKVSAS